MEISKRIRNARISHGMSLKEVAKRVGVTRPTVNRWENGTRKPTIYHLGLLEEILGLGVLSEDFVKETLSK